MRQLLIYFALVMTICSFSFGSDDKDTLGKMAERALQQSQLTMPGSTPFHIVIQVDEPKDKNTEFKATIEEYWASPQKWRRTIKSADFSQTTIVNGEKTYEKNEGSYYPLWLKNMVTAVFNPLPMYESIKDSKSPVGTPKIIPNATPCARFENRVGIPPIQNTVFTNICFNTSSEWIEFVVTPGYSAEFKEYRKFKDKRVARQIYFHPEPGVEIIAEIKELSEYTTTDESLFVISEATLEADRIQSIPVSESTARGMLAGKFDILWSTIRGGKTKGVLSLYLSIDKEGNVKETFPLNSDNSDLEDDAMQQVKDWKFKPAVMNGHPVQIETLFTFAFETKISNPLTILNNKEARELAAQTTGPINIPAWVHSGTQFTVRIHVTQDGKVSGTGNTSNLKADLFFSAAHAVSQWLFHPYLKNGKLDEFLADITFTAP